MKNSFISDFPSLVDVSEELVTEFRIGRGDGEIVDVVTEDHAVAFIVMIVVEALLHVQLLKLVSVVSEGLNLVGEIAAKCSARVT